ncbi:MAG: hypothetical protein EA399_17955 [Desulfovibrionales bacterium]|nr:MAG: hypothetical protein EA399_17955 [Desulfovibrionales bacterium]
MPGAVSAPGIAGGIQDSLAGLPPLEPYGGPLGLVLVVVTISCLTLIVDELVPQKLAVGFPEKRAGC